LGNRGAFFITSSPNPFSQGRRGAEA